MHNSTRHFGPENAGFFSIFVHKSKSLLSATVFAFLLTGAICTQAQSDKFFGCIWKEWDSVDACPASFTPLFNQVTSENAGKWESCETTRGKFSWTTLDAMYAWGDSTGSLVKQHCFVWGQQYPSWLNTYTNADTVKAIVTNWISTFLQRYGSKTDFIDVVNEPLSTPCPYASKLGSADPEWGWVVWSFQTTRNLCNQYAPNAKLILNDYGVVNDDNKTARAVSLINILKAKNLIDGFGEQGHFLEGADPAKIQRNLNRLVATGIPIYISEFELSIGNDQDQLNQYKKIFPIFWENPGVKGVTLWGYQQGTMWQADGYLLRSDGTERPALTWLKSYLAATTAASKNIHGSPAQRSAVSMSSIYIVDINASNANDDNAGTLAAPFKTIGKAASIMQPGDTCLIRQGTYREYINPARGGTSEQTRITYKAYPNEIPVILGSEKITGWVKESGNVYKAEVPNSLFGSFNPFAIRLNDPRGWIWYGTEYHLGDVYVKGESYKEKLSQSDVATSPKSWFASISASATTIWINYIGSSTPASETVEINVRESIIRPATAGVGYITIEGLTLRHSAAQWASCEDDQRGLIDFNGGRSWIVQNCRISDARNTAITSRGNSPTGHHIVRNNLIERCGQCGLAGNNGGWSFSLVEGNIIQDINMKDEFGGAETAMFKTHQPVDLVIRNNLFRRLKGHGWQFGIWLDVSAQGCRITGNVFADLISEGILLEVCHGPNLIDNNIFIPGSTGKPGFRTCSKNSILVHNLFFNSSDSRYIDGNGSPRSTPWFVPHTRTKAGGGQTLNLNDKYFNNLYIKGRNDVPQASQFASDFNAYFDGATGTSWGDKSSIVNSGTTANFMVTHLTNGVEVQFSMNDETIALKCPLITKDYIGIINPPNQGIENPDLTPITVDLDINGKTRNVNGPKVGPFEDIQAGLNSYTILFGVRDSANGATSIDKESLIDKSSK